MQLSDHFAEFLCFLLRFNLCRLFYDVLLYIPVLEFSNLRFSIESKGGLDRLVWLNSQTYNIIVFYVNY